MFQTFTMKDPSNSDMSTIRDEAINRKLMIMMDTIRTRSYIANHEVNNNHPVAQLIKHAYTDSFQVDESQEPSVVNRGLAIGRSLGFVTPNDTMANQYGQYIGNKLVEYVVLVNRPSQDRDTNWLDMRPLRLISHPYVTERIPVFHMPIPDMWSLPQGEEASAFLTLNVPVLLRQFRGYVDELTSIGASFSASHYVATVLLPSMGSDFFNIAMLNMGSARARGFRGNDMMNKHRFPLIDSGVSKLVKPGIIKGYTHRTLAQAFRAIPSIGSRLDTMSVYDVPQYGMYRVWSWMATARGMRDIATIASSLVIKRETSKWREFSVSYERVLGTRKIPEPYKKLLDEALILINTRK